MGGVKSYFKTEKTANVSVIKNSPNSANNSLVTSDSEHSQSIDSTLADSKLDSPLNLPAPAETSSDLKELQNKANKEIEKHFDYGINQPVEANLNAQSKSIAFALEHPGQYNERLSVLHQPQPFDKDAYQRNPQAYLDIIEPARVFQSAEPKPETPKIQRISEKNPNIKQLDSTELKVKVLPHMPVSFSSFDLGRFENELTSITVQADAEGFASCRFTASSGTIRQCNILASCPVTSGQIKFVVFIE